MSLPSRAAIAAYWSTVPVKWNDGTTHPMEHNDEGCWACGWDVDACGTLERAHLVPRSLGGSDEPSNLVLLCRSCHRKAPNTDDAQYMLDWVRGYADREAARFEETAREIQRLLIERNGRERAEELAERVMLHRREEFSRLLATRSSRHFGDGINAATFVWAFEQAATS
jgi:hypothetical protein